MLRGVEHYDHAVRSYLAIVGEALNQVSPEVKGTFPEDPWSGTKAMRNRIVHAYWRVDHEIIQRICRYQIPSLLAQLDGVIASLTTERSP